MKKNNIIVVEGKSDEAKIKSIFPNSNVIVTNGFNLNKEILKYLKTLSENNNIIVFTDPDWAGNKIREKINSYLNNNCQNAFISADEIINSDKKGVAEASDKQIMKALNNTLIFNDIINISWKEFIDNDLYKPINRKKISQFYGWDGRISMKKFYKYINYLNIDLNKINSIIKDKND